MSTTAASTRLGLRDAQLGRVLMQNNATSWFGRVEILPRRKSCWEAATVTTTTEKEAFALLVLACNVGDDLLHLVEPNGDPKAIWEDLQDQFLGDSTARNMHLATALSRLKKFTDEPREDFINRIGWLEMVLLVQACSMKFSSSLRS